MKFKISFFALCIILSSLIMQLAYCKSKVQNDKRNYPFGIPHQNYSDQEQSNKKNYGIIINKNEYKKESENNLRTEKNYKKPKLQENISLKQVRHVKQVVSNKESEMEIQKTRNVDIVKPNEIKRKIEGKKSLIAENSSPKNRKTNEPVTKKESLKTVRLEEMETPKFYSLRKGNSAYLIRHKEDEGYIKPKIVKFLRKDIKVIKREIPKSFLPVEKEKELSPAAKMDYLTRSFTKEEYQHFKNKNFQTPYNVQPIYDNYVTGIDIASKVQYKWNHLDNEREHNLWQNVEMNRYNSNISDPKEIHQEGAKFAKDEFGGMRVTGPAGASLETLGEVPTLVIHHDLDKNQVN